MKLEKEILKDLYERKTAKMYEFRHTEQLKSEEKRKIEIQNKLLKFLEERLKKEDYEKAFQYICQYSEESNCIQEIWNDKFYIAGYKEAMKSM